MADDTTKLKLVTPSPTPVDALDIESLWLDPGLDDALTDSGLLSIPVDKPRDFFRVHPDPAYRRRTELYAHKVEGAIETEYFILAPKMRGQLDKARPCTLVTCMYRNGAVRLWALMHPRDGERENEAWATARSAARIAMTKWVRLSWKGRAYETREAQQGYAPEPDWKKLPSFNDLVTKAFGSHGIIKDPTHSVYRDVMGYGEATAPEDDDAADL